MAKRYGLILPDKLKKPPRFEASRNVFGNDDSDEEGKTKPLIPTKSQRQAKVSQAKAIDEDPSVYQYDEVYDNIKEKEKEVKDIVKADKAPKYIENLLKTAQKRKLEHERRVERQVHKEREKEGNEFADKEVFVTSAYKKKLEEMRQEDEKEKREEYLEQIGDVTKQKDLGGFYRHLYEQKLGTVKVEKTENKDNEVDANKDKIVKENEPKAIEKDNEKAKARNYRKRKCSKDQNAELSDGEIVSEDETNGLNLESIREAKKNRTGVNIDADSDFSINDPTDSEDEPDNDTTTKKTKESSEKEKQETEIKEKDDKEIVKETKVEEIVEEPKPKIDIWKKRTVGEVFDEALKRYYERKASKSG